MQATYLNFPTQKDHLRNKNTRKGCGNFLHDKRPTVCAIVLVEDTCAVSRQARQPGRGRRSRPTGKKLRRRKLLEIAAESPPVGCMLCWTLAEWMPRYLKKGIIALNSFYFVRGVPVQR
jgi:hypothetical protein